MSNIFGMSISVNQLNFIVSSDIPEPEIPNALFLDGLDKYLQLDNLFLILD